MELTSSARVLGSSIEATVTREEERELEVEGVRVTLRTANGRAFMFRCLTECGMFEGQFNSDPLRMAHNTGLRSHGLWLDAELRAAAPELYWKMMRENRDD